MTQGKKTYSLAEIIRELIDNHEVYLTEQAIRDRFNKILKYAKINSDSLKNDDGEIFFFEGEKDLVKALLIELDKPYLQRLTSKKKVGKTIEDGLKEAKAFRDRMKDRSKGVKDQEILKSWEGIVELLSRYELQTVNQSIINRLKRVEAEIIRNDINYEELIEMMKGLDSAIQKWEQKYQERKE